MLNQIIDQRHLHPVGKRRRFSVRLAQPPLARFGRAGRRVAHESLTGEHHLFQGGQRLGKVTVAFWREGVCIDLGRSAELVRRRHPTQRRGGHTQIIGRLAALLKIVYRRRQAKAAGTPALLVGGLIRLGGGALPENLRRRVFVLQRQADQVEPGVICRGQGGGQKAGLRRPHQAKERRAWRKAGA